VFSRYVVGWMVAHRESARLAQKLIGETCARQGIAPGALTLHADRGSSMTSKPAALLLADLGVTKTHSRPHVSNDNPFSEAQFKTLKYRPDFPERFGSIEDAQAHCRVFFPWYNTEHRHTGIGLLTAHDVHSGLADQRVAARTGVLAAAYAAHPDRFVAGVPRLPARPTEVWIDPPPATAASTAEPAPAGSETFAFRAPYSHATESGRPDLRTENQPLPITRLPAIANEADEPAMTEAALH
jgi:putative transposase